MDEDAEEIKRLHHSTLMEIRFNSWKDSNLILKEIAIAHLMVKVITFRRDLINQYKALNASNLNNVDFAGSMDIHAKGIIKVGDHLRLEE